DRFQVAVEPWIERAGSLGLAFEHLLHDLEGSFRQKRPPARQQLVEDGAEAVHVYRRGQGFFAGGLLGRHISGGAEDGGGMGEGGRLWRLPGLTPEARWLRPE